jgi:hypothetical protein
VCTPKVFKSHIKSSQADFLYSSVLLKFTACFLLPLTTVLLRNSAHLYRCRTDTQHRKHMSRIRYPASILARWMDLQKTLHVTSTHCCVTHCWHKENTAPVLLAACVLRTLPSNGFTCHIIIIRYINEANSVYAQQNISEQIWFFFNSL